MNGNIPTGNYTPISISSRLDCLIMMVAVLHFFKFNLAYCQTFCPSSWCSKMRHLLAVYLPDLYSGSIFGGTVVQVMTSYLGSELEKR